MNTMDDYTKRLRRPFPVEGLALKLVVLSTIYMCANATSNTNSIVKYFTDEVNNGNFNHLVVDENSDRVYVGAVNMLYMLTDDLGLSKTHKTGPMEDSPNCPPPPDECLCSTNCDEYEKRDVNSINKGLLIDYSRNKLIVCMNIYQGHCEKRNLNDISSKDDMPFHPPVVPNDAESSVVMFIAPGPSKKDALYVGATRSTQGLPLYIDQVPAISTRNLTNFELAFSNPLGSSTKMEIETQHKDTFKVKYIYGFSSQGFSYFLVVQPDDVSSEYFGTRVIRVCQNDSKYTSYMEIPLTCDHDGVNYNLLRSAYVTKPGTNLAQDLGLPHIPPLDDVLVAVFARSEPLQSKTPGRDSVLCVYTLRAVRQVFTRTVQECFKGTGNTGPAHIISPETCIRVGPKQFPVGDDYCGEWEINHPIAGTEPIRGQSLGRFENTSVSSIQVIHTYKYTVAYLGTETGHLKKIVIESGTKAKEYDEVAVQPGSRINPDMAFDRSRMHIYVMTEKNVTKVKVQDCGRYTNCEECLGAGDPYCGWCSLERKCSMRSECEKPEEELRWLDYAGVQCTKIIKVLPQQVQIQREEPSQLTLTIQNLPTPTEGNYQCAFSGHGVVRMTDARRLGFNEPAVGNHTIQCETPAFNLLPVFPTSEAYDRDGIYRYSEYDDLVFQQDHIVMKLSVRVNMKDFVSTNFTFFDCAKHYQCTTCTSSAYPCTWCVREHRCTEKRETCSNDVLVTGKNVLGPTDRPGPGTCPRIGHSFREILVHDGVKKAISVTGSNLEEFQTKKLQCQFTKNINDVTVLDATYNANDETIQCGEVEFAYGTSSPDLNVHFSVVWGEDRDKIDNPDNIQVKVYKCTQKATNCGNCLTIDNKYGCGWCNGRCTIQQQCPAPGNWLDGTDICPNPKIIRISPTTGPREGGTNVTIEGENLGKVYGDVSSGVTIAGIPCRVFQDQYMPATKIVCETGELAPGQAERGPVTVIVNNKSDYKGSSQESFTYVQPQIKDFRPRKGPRSGGTYVTIEGAYMNAGTNHSATVAGVPCEVVSAEEAYAVCVTTSSSEIKKGKVVLRLDRAAIEYQGEKVFSFVNDPNITDVQPGNGIISGGSTIRVKGERLSSIQTPQMVVYFNGAQYRSNCRVDASDMMECTSPSFRSANFGDRMITADDSFSMSYGFLLDNVTVLRNYTQMLHGKAKFHLFPDPSFKEFEGGLKTFDANMRYLTIDGADMDLALTKDDVRVKIGEEDCLVTALSVKQLTCLIPQSLIENSNENEFTVTVEVGAILSEDIGTLTYKTTGPVFSFMNLWFIIGISTGATILIALIVIICVAYQRKSRESDRVMKRMQNQMDVLEARVAKECKEGFLELQFTQPEQAHLNNVPNEAAFAELQTEMTDLTGDLGGSSGIPFRDYRSFAMCVLFPNVPVHDHPVTRPFEVEDLMDPSRMESVQRGLRLFNQLIGNKIFLLLFIRTLEADSSFTAREKVNVASLISATLQNRMEYHTDILKTLLAELIEKTMESRNHPKLLLRRTESVAEKMLSNWFTFLLYKFLKECAGEPLFMLYRAIKQQVDKGPVDFITSEAKYSLSEDKLIRQQIDYKPMTIHVLDPEIQYGTQEHPVKVLDCDSISQVKEKILDTIYKHAPFSTRPTINDLDLEWRTGVKGRIILHDEDMTTKPEGEFRRMNTLTHYKVPDGAVMALIPKQSSMYNLSVTSDRTQINHSNHSNNRYGTMDLGYYTANSPSLGNSRSLSPHTIDLHVENGAKVYHLVKQHDADVQKEGERGSKMVSEIYLTRLLATKGTLQTFVDNLFETIFSTASRVSVLPLAIKYMFDFLDDQALHYGIIDPEVVHTWKSNSLPLRFWINVVKNPDFVFDIHKSNIVDSCLSVVAQTFMDSCSMSEHRLGKDSPSSKLLYAKDIPKYKKWVERYYQDIKQMPAISDQDMNALLADESRLHASQFNQEAALYELYQYVVKYNDELMNTLEEDEFARNYRLAYRLDQVHTAMESEV